MSGVTRTLASLLPLALLGGCFTLSSNKVSEPLQPAPGAPVSYLVGSIGPAAKDDAFTHQQLYLRQPGMKEGAAAAWSGGGAYHTPEDIKGSPRGENSSLPGVASVFVLPLKPGDYEFYDTSFYWPGGDNLSINAKRKFSVPMHLEAGKAYYVGEFRSRCMQRLFCFFLQRDEQQRDEVIARRYSPGLPKLEALNLDLKPAFPFIAPAGSTLPDSAAKAEALGH